MLTFVDRATVAHTYANDVEKAEFLRFSGFVEVPALESVTRRVRCVSSSPTRTLPSPVVWSSWNICRSRTDSCWRRLDRLWGWAAGRLWAAGWGLRPEEVEAEVSAVARMAMELDAASASIL